MVPSSGTHPLINRLQRNRKKILLWCMEEVRAVFSDRIGDVGFYTPTQMVLLQSNEIEVIFEVKGANPVP